MGSLRKLRSRTAEAAGKLEDRALHVASMTAHLKEAFQREVLDGLKTGPGVLTGFVRWWSWSPADGIKISVEESRCRQWLRGLVATGSVIVDGEVCWLAQEPFPPSPVAIQIYSHVPDMERNAASVAQIAAQAGLVDEAVEIALNGIYRRHGLSLFKTRDVEPLYFRLW